MNKNEAKNNQLYDFCKKFAGKIRRKFDRILALHTNFGQTFGRTKEWSKNELSEMWLGWVVRSLGV